MSENNRHPKQASRQAGIQLKVMKRQKFTKATLSVYNVLMYPLCIKYGRSPAKRCGY